MDAPVPVLFLEWVSSEGFMRLSKTAGHKWWKQGIVDTYTTNELFELFEDVALASHDEYLQQLEIESKRFGGV